MLRILFIYHLFIFYNLSYSQENYKNSVFLIQYCINDTCVPKATGFIVYDDTIGTNSHYLVTNLHVVKKVNSYLNQFVLSRYDSNRSLINHPLSLIKDTSFINSEYIDSVENIVWRNDIEYGQDIIILKIPETSNYLNYLYPINLSISFDYKEININDTLITFGFPAKEWLNKKVTDIKELRDSFKVEYERILSKLDFAKIETQFIIQLRERIQNEKNRQIIDSLNTILSDTSRFLLNKLSSLKNEADYLKRFQSLTTKYYSEYYFRPLMYTGYFNNILDSLIVKIDDTNTAFSDIIFSSVFANYGQSGSPLFLLRENKVFLVGIVFAKNEDYKCFAVPIKYLLNIIKGNIEYFNK
ncbi:MAG: hypothetical protein MUO34_12540 [Ignavibacteriaceae bacterium]|nr:hypothetical protein [Ignavibacteriaceae bacterium]